MSIINDKSQTFCPNSVPLNLNNNVDEIVVDNDLKLFTKVPTSEVAAEEEEEQNEVENSLSFGEEESENFLHSSIPNIVNSKSDGELKNEQQQQRSNLLWTIFERIFFAQNHHHNQQIEVDPQHRLFQSNQDNQLSTSTLSATSTTTTTAVTSIGSRARSSSASSLSESLSSLYLPFEPVQQLTSSIMSGINWINQLELSQSAVLQYISTLNPFRRRGSQPISLNKPNTSSSSGAGGVGGSSSATLVTSSATTSSGAAAAARKAKYDLDPFFYSQSTLQNRSFARILNDTMQTLKPSELIELSSFGLVEVDSAESGIGHEFQRYENDKPTWCDSCGEFLSTPVMNSSTSENSSNQNNFSNATSGSKLNDSTPPTSAVVQVSAPAAVQVEHVMRTYLYCRKCKYVCHVKCYGLIRIDCRPSSLNAEEIDEDDSLEISTDANRSQNILDSTTDEILIDSNNNKNIGDESGNNRSSSEQRRRRRQRQQQRRLRKTEFTEALNNGSIASVLCQSSELSSTLLNETNNSETTSTLCNGNIDDDNNATNTQETLVHTDDKTNDIDDDIDIGDDDSTCASLSEVFPSEINSETTSIVGCDTTTNNSTANNNLSMSTSISSSIVDQNSNLTLNSTTNSSSSSSSTASSAFDSFDGSILTPTEILNLKEKILKYNEKVRGRGSGLGITLINQPEQLFRGFLRVHMNLTRPINVISGKRPPSIYDIINEEENSQNPQQANNQQLRTLTSFYMPRDTVKNIHITSDSTSLQVIKAMLKKFKVVDNPQKFALYLRRRYPEDSVEKLDQVSNVANSTTTESLNNAEKSDKSNKTNEWTIRKFLTASCYDHSLKRLNDQERPLVLQLEFDSYQYGSVDIVLQENDNADIAWDAFEIPELKNFLKILDREEREHLEHVIAHYRELKQLIGGLVHYRATKQQFQLQQREQQQQQQQQQSLKESTENNNNDDETKEEEENSNIKESQTEPDLGSLEQSSSSSNQNPDNQSINNKTSG